MHRFVACVAAAILLPGAALAQSRDEVQFMINLFERLQPLSFAKHREYCGFVGFGSDGQLDATEPAPGNMDSCPLDWPQGMDVIASYHTHGAFDFAYYNELPSDVDMLSDQSLQIDGWIATPGGRLWFVDWERMVTKQVCGVGCLPIAPNFYKSQAGDVAKAYTYDELVERLSR
ncbi:DUF4329 domain-containing protein [Rubellimicrobium arenae]|uniref:DUF4329 domain-containing protein n=1 Tax=Rubellimicrobium arenae TaxID=2817372 RepID=UPI001B31441E|nr:DUF4329 domain-containing protein [Rubellimicrobium arenae]